MLDPVSAIFGRLAVFETAIVGFTVNVVHDSTWTAAPVCYLEDLFVDPNYRNQDCFFDQELVLPTFDPEPVHHLRRHDNRHPRFGKTVDPRSSRPRQDARLGAAILAYSSDESGTPTVR